MARKIDGGLDVVKQFARHINIEEERCVQGERGFTWWGEDLAQHVWADRAVDREGTRVWKVHARTDFLTDFVDNDENLGMLSELASHASLGGGLIRDSRHRNRIQLASCLYATEATLTWAKLFFPTTAIIQVAEAEAMAKLIAPMMKLRAAYSTHPLGPRKRHPALDVLGTFVRAGKSPPVWPAEEFDLTAAEIASAGGVFPSRKDSGLSIEFPFRDSKALCEMTTKTVHASYGNGLLVRLTLPIMLSEAEEPAVVLRCNRLEIDSLTQVSHLTGSYHIEEHGVCYSNFIPNLPAFNGVPFLVSLITFMGLRAQWLAEVMVGDDWPLVEPEKKPRKWMN